MIAITIRLPYAAAIRAGVKTTENRGRPIAAKHIGQQVGIHAAAAWSKEGEQDERIRRWWWGPNRTGLPLDGPVAATDFSRLFRNIIAVATIAGCHRADVIAGCCQPWGDWDYGNSTAWHIVLADIVALPRPVGPVRGSLPVPWTLPDDVAAQVTEQLAEVAS